MNKIEAASEISKVAGAHNLAPLDLMGKLQSATPGENGDEGVLRNRAWLIQALGEEETDRLLTIWAQSI